MAKAKFRMIHTSFWSDGKVSEEMTPEDKFFMLYLLTNEHTTQTGIYQITKKKIAFDMGYSMETIGALMERFESYHKSIVYNKETRELAIVNWGKYNLTRAGKPMEDCVKSELKLVEDVSLIELVGKSVESPSLKAIYDTYTLRDTSRGQEEEEEEEEEEELKPFVTSEEVTEVKQSKSQLIKEQALRVYEFYKGITKSRISPTEANMKEVTARLRDGELTENDCYAILKYKHEECLRNNNFKYYTLISLFRKSNSANTMQQIELMKMNKPMSEGFNNNNKTSVLEEIANGYSTSSEITDYGQNRVPKQIEF